MANRTCHGTPALIIDTLLPHFTLLHFRIFIVYWNICIITAMFRNFFFFFGRYRYFCQLFIAFLSRIFSKRNIEKILNKNESREQVCEPIILVSNNQLLALIECSGQNTISNIVSARTLFTYQKVRLCFTKKQLFVQ